ncbi:hypothetical protein GCM10012275_55070 [Longimycelium tulufanense]|uniref:Uncharacterized protein n=1 Tax=Longimycelium tulufanense TaxID=907463 RepID=A0A8J3CDG6_9PSEU|nr:hypothetical protein [Longimycelium tulufanense]GGM77387.1 hypothetical protein GCM10012275_55070 [Longimycelium tulufanense]
MSTYQQLTTVAPDHGRLVYIGMRFEINGVMWEVPRPFLTVGDNLVISPLVEPHESSLRVRLDRWQVLRLFPPLGLPVWVPSQALAARMARDFEHDPAISFQHSPDALEGWALRWYERNSDAEAAARASA